MSDLFEAFLSQVFNACLFRGFVRSILAPVYTFRNLFDVSAEIIQEHGRHRTLVSFSQLPATKLAFSFCSESSSAVPLLLALGLVTTLSLPTARLRLLLPREI